MEETKKFADGSTRDDDFGGYMVDRDPKFKAKMDKIKADAMKQVNVITGPDPESVINQKYCRDAMKERGETLKQSTTKEK